MSKQYKTSQIAAMMGVHPNTVRLYEDCGFISKPQRLENGYRVFTDLHVAQFQIARTALQVEILQAGLRKQIIGVIKLTALCQFEEAIAATQGYIRNVKTEKDNAEEALAIAKDLLSNFEKEQPKLSLNRQQAAKYLDVTMDTLRNWELNGLLQVKRKQNGYRFYTGEDLRRLKIIRSLRCANYSLSAILRMLGALSKNAQADIRAALDTPKANEDIVTACDKLLTSLDGGAKNAKQILCQLESLKISRGTDATMGDCNPNCAFPPNKKSR